MKVKAVVFDRDEQISIREVGLPELQPNQIRTETLYSFVSPGTELRTLAGHYGASKNFPIIPGYSSVSRVVEIGPEVKGYRIGDLLSLREGFFLTAKLFIIRNRSKMTRFCQKNKK